jgi:hypothetical protein
MRNSSSRARILSATGVVIFALGLGESGCSRAPSEDAEQTHQAAASKYDWLQFGGDSRHGGNNTLETHITPQNVGSLQQLFQVQLPETVEGAPVVLTNVSTTSGVHDIAYVTTRNGFLVALDASTGATIWSRQPSSSNITMSSPAIDPSLQYVYSNGLDGHLHKYTVADGTEITTGGWPQLLTLKTGVEKGGTAVTIATVGASTYLYMADGAYIGDAGEYQGHVTTIDLDTGKQIVFNAMCSDQTVHFTLGGSPDCSGQKSGIWAKAGVTFDPATQRLYAVTGNGTFNPGGKQWGDSILAINADGTGKNGGPVDSYTPSNYQSLQNNDADLGSTNLLILANNGSKYSHLGMQSGKDEKLRLINLDNLSGQGGPGHVGGEVSSTALPTGGEVQNPCATWINPADNVTWVFVVSPTNGINALRLAVDGGGNPSLVPVWNAGGGGGGAAIANNVLYYASNQKVHALNPTTGAELWSNTGIGAIHWQTPTVVNGVLYIADNGRRLTAFSVGGTTGETPLSRAGWTATASSSAGGDVPSNALDGDTGTRWSTGAAMANGMYFQVDMQAPQTFDEVTLDAAGSMNDYARGYQIYVSNDGTTFGSPIASGSGAGQLIQVKFAAQSARYLKIVQTGAASNWWSIAELNVYTSGSASPPAPPSGLGASGASSSSIQLTWTPSSTSGVTYSVFRSTTASFTPGAANQVASGLTTASYSDSGLSSATTYYYYVEAVGAGGVSSPSNEANATTAACTSGCGAVIQIDCGGGPVAPYAADQDFNGGRTINHANTMDLSGVSSPAPAAVYQSARIGDFTYTISGFAPGSTHTVRLHFAETYFNTSGSRVFNVALNGSQVLTSFDIVAATGAENKAIVKSFNGAADASGAFTIAFTSVVNNSLISAIDVQ